MTSFGSRTEGETGMAGFLASYQLSWERLHLVGVDYSAKG